MTAAGTATAPRRSRPPFTILLVAVFGVVLGVIAVLYGISLMVDRDDAGVRESTGLSSGQLLLYGIGAIAIGVVLAGLSISLARGSRSARWTVGLLTFLLLWHGVVIVFGWYDVSPWEGVTSIVIAVAALYLLYGSARSRGYYARAATEPIG
jgi:hypothetical protein